jgi:hypothetical protein
VIKGSKQQRIDFLFLLPGLPFNSHNPSSCRASISDCGTTKAGSPLCACCCRSAGTQRPAVTGREHPFADLGVKSILTVEMPSRGVTVYGWERHLADPAVSSILIARLPSPAMTAVVTDLPIVGRPLTGDSGSTPACCAVQFNVSFLRS